MEKVKLGDYVKQIRGVSYKPTDLHNELNSDSVILLRANNINDGKINFDDIVYIDKSKVKEEQYLKRGDILVCASSGSKELVGKSAFINKDYDVTFGAFCKLIRPKDCIAEYLGHYFNSQIYKEKISSLALGANINNIRNEHINELIVYLPNKAEQQNISILLDEVVDIIDKRKQQLEKLDELVKARFVEMFGDPQHNRDNFVKIEDIGMLTSGGTPSRAKSKYFEGDIRWYNAGELNTLYLPDSTEHISEIALQQSSAKLFEKGSLMIGMYDTAAFKMGILTEDSSSNQACANLNPRDGYNVIWLYYLFDIMKPVFLRERQGVRQKNLSLTKIKEFEVPSAPTEQQNQFATFVEQVDKSKFEIKQSLEKLELLKKSLMQKYFG